MERKIIAFCGAQGGGKDFNARRLVMTRGFRKVAFADALRKVAFEVINLPFEEGMKKYDELKRTNLMPNLTFRNILENLGSGIRYYDKDFWVKATIKDIEKDTQDVCISDLRYYNEYKGIKEYCKKKGYKFTLIFCDYKGNDYKWDNEHESARLATYLKRLGYSDMQTVAEIDMESYSVLEK